MAQESDRLISNAIQIQKFLGGIDYPADKATLVAKAKEKGDDENVLHALSQLGDKRYNSPNDVSEEIGKLR